MLRFIDVNLKVISDVAKYQFIESTIRGGISIICKGYAEANNKFLNHKMLINLLNISSANKHIIYLDPSNLYGQPTMQVLPTEILL